MCKKHSNKEQINLNKKVGVITMHGVINYGSFLQAYATQQAISKLGYECEIIDYKFPNDWHISNGLKQNKIRYFINNKIYSLGLSKGHRKTKKIKNAISEHLNLSAEYRSRKEIREKPPIYDVYITGSDQTWNTKHTMGDSTFLLDFVPDEKKKIAFSASLARKKIDEKFIDQFERLMRRYNNISIRDTNGSLAIKEITGFEPEVTLDPTLLLDKETWVKFASNKINKYEGKKYIVFYLITHSFDPRPYIYNLLKDLQDETKLEVFSFSKIPKEFDITFTDCSDIGVEDFIHLFANASYVVTSSFHGTAFAANFGIPMYSIVNDLDAGDDRQSSLLNKLEISNCLVTQDMPFRYIQPRYEVDIQQVKLQRLRERSFEYLKNSI
ncbi:polysaccharide pyruvyl transferase family protein [Vibrio cholerae]|nr:polysaccharide pyruvyl transferase family protein [Vibrio cholerae]